MEGIILNAKSTGSGTATATLVMQAIRAKKIFVFGELLALPQVQSLRNSPETAPTLNALEIFAFGTYADYVKQSSALPELGDVPIFKLRQLTVVFLASKMRSLPYELLMRETNLKSIREVEDLVIACVYDGLLKARLDQRGQKCLIQWSAARDVRPETLDNMINKLNSWCSSADDVLAKIDQSMAFQAQQRQMEREENKLLLDEVENIKIQVMRESSESTLGHQMGEPAAKKSTASASKMISSVQSLLGRRG